MLKYNNREYLNRRTYLLYSVHSYLDPVEEAEVLGLREKCERSPQKLNS